MHISSFVALLALTPIATLASTVHQPKPHVRRSIAVNPANHPGHNSTRSLNKRAQHENVRATWYVTDVAPGACGKVSPRNGYTIALNGAEYGSGGHCWEQVTISYKGKTATATIADECPEEYCSWGQIDMSEGLFRHFADLGAGVLYVDWDFGAGGGDPDPEPPKPKTTSTKEEETSTSTRPRTTSTKEEETSTSEAPTTTSSSIASTTSASSASSASLSSTGTESSISGTGSQSSGTRTGTAGAAPTKGASALATGNNINSIFQLVVQLGEIASH